MTAVGWIGIWLLAGGLAAIVLELALIGARLLRLQRKAAALRSLLDGEGALRDHELERLQRTLAQITFRLRPYRHARRLALHPLTLALIASYRRRQSRR
jgi:hypothetical protein